VAAEFRQRDANVWVASAGDAGAGTLPIASISHAVCAPLVSVASFYRAANALALRRGRNPDVPPNVHKVTETV